ncbi:MAG: ABC transporter ATP-binding protein [Pseudomonadota bacterium]|nr:ABC transporter ATP-binding protein [Pseudomonadota bacterium]
MLENLKKIYEFAFKSSRIQFFWILMLMVVATFLELLALTAVAPFLALAISVPSTYSSNIIIDSLYKFLGHNIIYDLGMMIIGLLMISMGFSILVSFIYSKYVARIGASISNKAFRLLCEKKYTDFVKIPYTEILHSMETETKRLVDHVFFPYIVAISRAISVLVLVFAILIFEPIIAVVGAILISITYYIVFKFTRLQLLKVGDRLAKSQSKRYELINSLVRGFNYVLMRNVFEFFCTDYDKCSKRLSISQAKINVYAHIPRQIIEFVVFGSLIGFVVLQAYLGRDLLNEMPKLAVLSLIVIRIMPSFQQFFYNIAQVEANINSLFHVESKLLNEQEKVLHDNKSGLLPQMKNLAIRNVDFFWDGNNGIKDISLDINLGDHIALVGMSGSGKTTLIKILCGLIQPNRGTIMLNNKKVETLCSITWREHIGYLAQDPFLYSGSVIQNVAFGRAYDQVDVERVNQVLDMVGLLNFIDKLPDKLNFIIGDDGSFLSGGQRQRLALARILYDLPSLIILDEATSSLDGITEKAIFESIAKINRPITILQIAHRKSAISYSDRVIELSAGNIIWKGSTVDYLNG